MIPALKDSPRLLLLTLCLLYLAQGLPYGFVTVAQVAYLATGGLCLTKITELIFIAQVPWIFKFVWGPIIDRFGFPSLQMERRRVWILPLSSIDFFKPYLIEYPYEYRPRRS